MQLTHATDLIPGTHRCLAFAREALADESIRQAHAGLSAKSVVCQQALER